MTQKKLKIGIILRGRAREKDVKLMAEHFRIKSFKLPSDLPEFIEEPERYLKFDADFLDSDILVSYAAHPDINLELIKRASESGIGLIIFSGGTRAGSPVQLKKEGEKQGIRVIWEEICCATPQVEGKYSEFFKYFGAPEFEVEVENGRVVDTKVKRSAFCGASWFVAEKIKGLPIDEAPTKAGYFTQIFPCYATRGIQGGIHRAARIHKRAVEKAIKKAMEGRRKSELAEKRDEE